jgi:DNA repair exonuclease SbcCD ATPase subunit
MWLFFWAGWFGLLAVVAVFASQAFGYNPGRILQLFWALPATQRTATGALLFMVLSFIAAALLQAHWISRQERSLKSLRDRLKGARHGAATAQMLQTGLDVTVQHLAASDPEEAISSLQKKLVDTEQRIVLQQGRNAAADIDERVEEIRLRQQALREMVGSVADERRAIEPAFTELADRQRQLDRSLIELEATDNKKNVADRLKELDGDVSTIRARLNALRESFGTLNRFKDELGKSRAELEPLRAPDHGINALIAELRSSRDQLAGLLDELESSGNDALSSRVEALSVSKLELERRVARVDDCAHVLDSIRLDFEELSTRQATLERSLAETETDSSGKSLIDRQNALNEFVIQSRLRLRTIQDSCTTLNAFKEELARSQSDLVPLQAPVFGVEGLISDVLAARDLLTKTLDEIELKDDARLDSRVDALSKNKRELDERVAKMFENFATLDVLRKDIGGIFTTIRNTLNRIG